MKEATLCSLLEFEQIFFSVQVPDLSARDLVVVIVAQKVKDACIEDERQYRAPHLPAGFLTAAMSRVAETKLKQQDLLTQKLKRTGDNFCSTVEKIPRARRSFGIPQIAASRFLAVLTDLSLLSSCVDYSLTSDYTNRETSEHHETKAYRYKSYTRPPDLSLPGRSLTPPDFTKTTAFQHLFTATLANTWEHQISP
ncbi:hypothetical protein F511_04849 [Dorcoceras hygrometricum]|uniref:Uncharacterized protein n=1 Tax=Dorcoceras hygrometricum TaxID=472368 RepID=A0A2Z7DCP4_9LAMI|nr:hypothetical protein F511_04849 [Dorcoceras hygrometricum]